MATQIQQKDTELQSTKAQLNQNKAELRQAKTQLLDQDTELNRIQLSLEVLLYNPRYHIGYVHFQCSYNA